MDKSNLGPNRRTVLQSTIGILAGIGIQGKSTAESSRSSTVSLRGDTSSPITEEELKSAVEDRFFRSSSRNRRRRRRGRRSISDNKPSADTLLKKQLTQHDIVSNGHLVAVNIIMNNGTPSLYYGIIRPDNRAGAVKVASSDKSPLDSIHENADSHLRKVKQASRVKAASSDAFSQVSDVRLDFKSEKIPPSEAQFRIYVSEFGGNPDYKVFQTRVDQRLANHTELELLEESVDGTITHNYNKLSGAKLADWSPAPNTEQTGSGNATVSVGPTGPSASYTYSFNQSGVSVSDSSPFGNETARAEIQLPQRYVQRFRAESASLCDLSNFDRSAPTTPDFPGTLFPSFVQIQYDGGFMYADNCGGGLCKLKTEPINLDYAFYF